MLLARRRPWWLLACGAIFVNCAEEPEEPDVTPTPTSIVVTPESFLGSLACGTEPGGLLAYQATLIDVTEGWDGAPRLPSSPVVDCTSTLSFETVQLGRRYGALIAAFDRNDLRQREQGSSVVVDPDGNEVAPRWTTSCTGHDGEIEAAFGGAGGESMGGWTGNISLGALALEYSAVEVGGCAPLSGTIDPSLTGVRVDLTAFLGGLSCGEEPGQVLDYSVELLPDGNAVGGAGGIGGSDSGEAERTACAIPFVLRGLDAQQWLEFEVLAYEPGASSPTWSTTCTARTELGVVRDASCGNLRAL